VNCEETRLRIGADPGASDPLLEEHLLSCPGCRAFRDEMRALDANIRRAMAQPPELARPSRQPAPWRQWALAASALLAAFAVLAVWLLRPSDTLAHEVVVHVQGEPESWFAAQHVSAQSIDQVLLRSGVRLDISSDEIMYAQSCFFRGHYVPHLVVQTERGPATVLILRHEHVSGRSTFHEAGMSGVIVPDGAGSIAVLSRGGGSIEDIATHMSQDVHWLPEPPR
jgi:hypothetical protein